MDIFTLWRREVGDHLVSRLMLHNLSRVLWLLSQHEGTEGRLAPILELIISIYGFSTILQFDLWMENLTVRFILKWKSS